MKRFPLENGVIEIKIGKIVDFLILFYIILFLNTLQKSGCFWMEWHYTFVGTTASTKCIVAKTLASHNS